MKQDQATPPPALDLPMVDPLCCNQVEMSRFSA